MLLQDTNMTSYTKQLQAQQARYLQSAKCGECDLHPQEEEGDGWSRCKKIACSVSGRDVVSYGSSARTSSQKAYAGFSETFKLLPRHMTSHLSKQKHLWLLLLCKSFGVFFPRRHCSGRNQRFGTTCVSHHQALKYNP
jgi:hypothetical protein